MVTNNVYAIAGAKGGVGKTTTSLNLAAALAADGFSVVAVEMDLSMPNFVDFLALEYDPGEDTTLREVLSGSASIADATYATPGGFSVVPSRPDNEAGEQSSPEELGAVIRDLRWRFDIVFLDTPAGHSDQTIRAMTDADDTIIISTPRTASLQNANNTIDLANHHDANIRGFILNKSGTGASPGVDTIADALSIDLLGHVPDDDAVPHAQDQGEAVVTHSPNSGAAIAYTRLANGAIESDQPSQQTDQDGVQPNAESSSSGQDSQEPLYRGGSPSTDESDSSATSDSPWTFPRRIGGWHTGCCG